MPDPGAGVLLATEGGVFGAAGLAIAGAVSLLLIVVAVLLGFGFWLAGVIWGVDAKFVPGLPVAGFCLGAGVAATFALGKALFVTALGAGAAGFLTGLTIFLAAGLTVFGLAATGLTADGLLTAFLALAGTFLLLAGLGLPALTGLLFITGLPGFLIGFLGATLLLELLLDFPAEDFLALFVFAILGTLP